MSNITTYKVIILNQTESLSLYAHIALTKTVKKYMSVCRLLLLRESLTYSIFPISSICLCIRIGLESIEEIY